MHYLVNVRLLYMDFIMLKYKIYNICIIWLMC